MQTFTYIVTDLTEFESEPVDMEMETDEEAVMYGAHMARELGDPISIVPLDRGELRASEQTRRFSHRAVAQLRKSRRLS